MRLAVSVDELAGVAEALPGKLRALGHEVVEFGAFAADHTDDDWVACSAQAAAAVTTGSCDQAVVACWTGTGASMAANKVPGVRAALCTDAATAAGARRWNDANCLVLSMRLTSSALLDEILEAWFTAPVSHAAPDRANLDRLRHLDAAPHGEETPS